MSHISLVLQSLSIFYFAENDEYQKKCNTSISCVCISRIHAIVGMRRSQENFLNVTSTHKWAVDKNLLIFFVSLEDHNHIPTPPILHELF